MTGQEEKIFGNIEVAQQNAIAGDNAYNEAMCSGFIQKKIKMKLAKTCYELALISVEKAISEIDINFDNTFKAEIEKMRDELKSAISNCK